jgi:hypothetical protein
MGRFDNRRTPKMRRRKRQRALKTRLKRRIASNRSSAQASTSKKG